MRYLKTFTSSNINKTSLELICRSKPNRVNLGTDRMRNVAHASDSPENAQVEIERFFSDLFATA